MPSCPVHPQARLWESTTGTRCAICGERLTDSFGKALEPPANEPTIVRTFGVYQDLAVRTSQYRDLAPVPTSERDWSPKQFRRVSQSTMGLSGEVGELIDELKKTAHHEHALNMPKVAKEMGDVLWYLAELATTLGLRLDEVATQNIAKLRARYPDGFNAERSRSRAEET